MNEQLNTLYEQYKLAGNTETQEQFLEARDLLGEEKFLSFVNSQIEEKKKDNPNQNLAIGNPQSEMDLTTSVPISQDLDLNEAQIQAMNQVENPTLQSSDTPQQQDSTDLPLIQTVSSGLESSNTSQPTFKPFDSGVIANPITTNQSEIDEYNRYVQNRNRSITPSTINATQNTKTDSKGRKATFTFGDDTETIQLPKVESNLDILAGKSNDTDEISDESQQFFDKYLNKDYIDTKTQLSKQPFDTFGVSQDENEDNILLLEDKGIVEIKRDTEGNLVNENNKYVYKIVDKDYYDNVYSPYIDKKQEELTNKIKEQNVDSARFNFKNTGNEPEQDSYGEFVTKANDLGVLLSNEDSENITTYEDRQNFLATLEATNNAQKNGTTVQFEYDKLGSKYLLSEEDKIANGYDGINLITNGIKDGKVKDKEESDFFNKFFTQKENVLDFGEYWNNEGKSKYGGSQVRENQANYQNYRANIFNDFLSYKNDKYGTDMRFIEEAVTKSSNLADKYYTDGDFNAANVELAKVEKLYNQYNNNEANRQNISNVYTESNKAFTTYNKQKKEESEFQLKVENGEFVDNAKNILGQVALGIGSSVTSTITGLGRIVSSALPSDNLKDGLDIISDTELKVGNVKVASLTNKIKEFVGSDGLKYKEINGVTYLQNSDGKLSKNGYVQSGNEKVTKEDVEYNYGAGLTFVTSKMGADILITNAVGGGINRVLASSSTRLSNLKNIEKVFGLDSQVAKNAQSFAKLAKNTDNISVTGWYVQMYNDSYKMAEEGGINGNVNKHIYAMTQSLIQSVIQRINPDINFLKSMNTESRQIVRALMTNNKDKAIQLFSAFAKKAGNNVAKETGEEVIQQVVQDFNNVVINKLADTQLATTDAQGYKEVVFATVVPSIVASLMGGKGSRIANINNKEIDLTTYSRLDLITELARDKKGIEIVKDFKDTAYFPSQKQLGTDLENQIITAQKQIAKIPESNKYSTSSLSEVTPILQEIERKKETLKTDDGTFSKKINEEIDLLVTKVNSILDNDLNPVTNNNAETTQSTPQSEAVQEQTAETRIDLNAKTGEELYVTEENSVEESPINTNQNETQEEQPEQVVAESSETPENVTNETDISSVPQQDENSNQVAEDVNEDDIILPDDALDLINSLSLDNEATQSDNTTTDGNVQPTTDIVQQQGENNDTEKTTEPTTSKGEVEVKSLNENQTQLSDNTIATSEKTELPDGTQGYIVKITDNNGNPILDKNEDSEYDFASKEDADKFIAQKKRGFALSNNKKPIVKKESTTSTESNVGKKVEFTFLGEKLNGEIGLDDKGNDIIIGDDGKKYSSGLAKNVIDYKGAKVNLQSTTQQFTPITQKAYNKLVDKLLGVFKKFGGKVETDLDKFKAKAKSLGIPESSIDKMSVSIQEFRDGHTAPSMDDLTVEDALENSSGFNLAEVARGQHNQPSDYFDEKVGARYYGYGDTAGMESATAIRNIVRALKSGKNSKDLTITIYRSVPNNVNEESLIQYDWVSPSKKYAENHGESRFGEGEYKIIEQEVPITHVWWDGNDIREWGYDPSNDIRFMKTANGEIYGAKLPDGTIYLNPDKVNANTPIHEFSHLWQQLMPTRFKQGVEILKNTPIGKKTFAELKQNEGYANKNDAELWNEALVTVMGNEGERIFNSSKASKLKTWITDLFKKLGDAFGIRNLTPTDNLSVFVKGALKEVMGEKEIFAESSLNGNNQMGIDFSLLTENDFDADGNVKPEVLAQIEAEKKSIIEKAKADGTYLKAPNGKKTKLNEEQWVSVRTDRFKNWFGDWENDAENSSKVVDENGEPMVVYHGTKQDFTKFKSNSHFGGNIEQSLDRLGFYHDQEDYDITSIKDLENRAKENGNIIMRGFLNIKNPLLIDRDLGSWEKQRLEDNGLTNEHDGVFYDNWHEGIDEGDNPAYIIIAPNQIKSATSNAGTYSNKNNRIDFSIIGEKGAKNNPKPTYLMPKSLIEGITSSIRNGGKSDVIIALTKDSKWFNSLSEKKQNEFSVNDVKQIVVDSVNYYKGADAVKLQETKDKAKAKLDSKLKEQKDNASEKLKETKEKSKEKLQKTIDSYKEKINKIKDEYKEKLKSQSKVAQTAKERIAEKIFWRKQAVNSIKLLLKDKTISDKITPNEVVYLINESEKIANARDIDKAFDKFNENLDKVISRAEERLKDKKTKYNEKLATKDVLEADPNVVYVNDKPKNKFIAFKEKWFANEGGVLKPIMNVQDKATGKTNLEIRDAKILVARLNKEARKSKFDTDENWEIFNDALRGEEGSVEAYNKLPDNIKPFVNEMRQVIDGKSEFLIVEGLVSSSQAQTIEENLGKYISRAYDFFESKNDTGKVFRRIFNASSQTLRNYTLGLVSDKFKDNESLVSKQFDRKKWNEAVTIFQQNELNSIAMDGSGKYDNWSDDRKQAYARKEGERMLESYITDLSSEYTQSKSSKGANLDILKQRKEVPSEIRALLGEYTDPRVAYAITVARISQMGNQRKFLQQVRDIGMGTLFYEEGATNIPSTHTVKIASDSSQPYSPLNGLYTTPEFKDVFLGEAEAQSKDLIALWIKLTGGFKYGKTILSPMTQAVNFSANFGFLVMNGLYDVRGLKAGAKIFADEMRVSKKDDAFVRELIEENIVGQNINLNEIQDDFHKNIEKSLINDIKRSSTLKNVAGYTIQVPQKLYKASDDFFKAYAYFQETNDYAKSIYGKPYKELVGEERSRVRAIASEVVKNTLANYDRKYKGADAIRKTTRNLLGNFLSFQAESIRTFVNAVQIANRDIRNPETRSVGIRRLAGIMAYNTVYGATTSLIGKYLGIGLTGLLSAFNDDDEDDKNTKLNNVVAPWARSTEKYFKFEDDNTLTYYTYGNINPYGITYRVMNAYKNGTDNVKGGGVLASLGELTEPFASTEMSVKWLLNVNAGQNDYGKELIGADDYMKYTLDKLSPTFIKVIKDNIDGNDKNDFELINMIGIKKYNIDPTSQLNFRFSDYQNRINKVGKEIYGLRYKVEGGSMSPEEASIKHQQLLDKQKDITDEFIPILEAHIAFGARIDDKGGVLDKGNKTYLNTFNSAKDWLPYLLAPKEVREQNNNPEKDDKK